MLPQLACWKRALPGGEDDANRRVTVLRNAPRNL